MHPVRAEVFYGDGRTDERTDMTKLIVALRNFAKAPKNKNKKSVSFAILRQ